MGRLRHSAYLMVSSASTLKPTIKIDGTPNLGGSRIQAGSRRWPMPKMYRHLLKPIDDCGGIERK